MIDSPFRRQLPRFTPPLILVYKKLGLTPNQISIGACLLSLISAALVAKGCFVEACAIWWVGRLLDGTDGIYARQTGQATPFGAFLDIQSDMASYSAMILGFYFAFPQLVIQWMLILILYVLCITGALALGNLEDKEQIPSGDDRGLRLAAGVAEGGETGIAYTLFLLLPSLVGILSYVWISILSITVVARLILANKYRKKVDSAI